MKRVVKAYEDFRGETPRETVNVRLPDHDQTAWHMGTTEAIAYRTVRDGKLEHYIHEFKKNAGPEIAVSEDGRKVHLIDGNFRVTNRGFEDNKSMPNLLIVNPRKRGTKAKRKVNPMARHRRRRHNPTVTVARTRPRRRKSGGAKTIIVRANPVAPLRRHRRRRPVAAFTRRRRNPIFGRRKSKGGGGKGALNIVQLLKNGLAQGGGAVLTSIAAGMLPLPANLKSGPLAGATKAVIGIGLGMLVAKFINRNLGQQFAEGAVVISMYDAIKGFVPKGINMGEMYDYNMGAMYEQDMSGLLFPSTGQDFGFVTAANTVSDQAFAYPNYAL